MQMPNHCQTLLGRCCLRPRSVGLWLQLQHRLVGINITSVSFLFFLQWPWESKGLF